MLTTENWTFTRFEQGNYRALISFGADPESLEAGEFLYYVTLTEGEEKEMFQVPFRDLALAVSDINDRFSHWIFRDLLAQTKEGGCSSCSAH